LVAASCILTSGLKLNVSTSLVDDEGVDLVFHRRGKSTTLAVQVKSRSMATKGISQHGRFYAQVKRGRRIFSASSKEGSQDQWSKYRVAPADLAGELLAVIRKLGPK
jgi:uncharacterized protein GlcG (DUF336 family)